MNSSRKKSSATKVKSRVPASVWAAGIVILGLGVLIGYAFRSTGSQSASSGVSQTAPSAVATTPAPSQASFDAGMRSLLDRLNSDPTNAALLIEIGNRYYDHKDWNHAVPYYRRALQVQPGNVDVRTDLGTTIWYGGDPWNAIKEYKTALRYQPDYAQTLFNMGIVQWQGMHDDRAALKTWQTLLQAHPDYADRQKIEEYMKQLRDEMNRQGAASSGR